MGSFYYSQWKMNELKIYRGVMCQNDDECQNDAKFEEKLTCSSKLT